MTPSPSPLWRAVLAMGRLGRAFCVSGAVLWVAGGAIAEETEDPVPIFLEYSTGFDFSHGDYGFDRDSSLYYVPLGVTVDRGYFRFRATIPFLYNDGSTTVGGGADPVDRESDRTAGLGLALVSKIVAENDGWIAVTSKPGRTVFRISLPVAPKGAKV